MLSSEPKKHKSFCPGKGHISVQSLTCLALPLKALTGCGMLWPPPPFLCRFNCRPRETLLRLFRDSGPGGPGRLHVRGGRGCKDSMPNFIPFSRLFMWKGLSEKSSWKSQQNSPYFMQQEYLTTSRDRLDHKLLPLKHVFLFGL